MVFTSFVFLFWFLPLFLAGYFATPPRMRNLLLTAGSLVFYGWWRPHYVLLMLLCVALNYGAARAMGNKDSGANRKLWVVFAVTSNLALLCWFKYANLLVGSWNVVAPWPVEWEEVLLPVGISFFTFQAMSYAIDVYRGDAEPERSFLDLLCYVAMFPQLVAGPIVRYIDVRRELHERSVNLRKASDGVFLVAFGFAKKILVADSVGALVDAVYAQDTPGLAASWLAALGYSVQLYFDFSGYSDMAIGLGLILGFRFPPNFLSPYRAHSMTELWRRWHVSLSTWLRDYLYVPLGGNRRGEGIAQRNVVITMLLGGLWHGASWTFLLWGAWHGLFLAFERRLGKVAPYGQLPRVAQIALTFLIWTLGLVLFRCQTIGELGQMTAGMLGTNGIGALPNLGNRAPDSAIALVTGLLIAFAMPRSEQLVARCNPIVMLGSLLAFGVAVAQLLGQDLVAFLYFQF
jgi:alginate O-acetyltransferase complex protein AlgI